MKVINFDSGLDKAKKAKPENINISSQGITMRLLEKYKPKGDYEIEKIHNKKNQKRVA